MMTTAQLIPNADGTLTFLSSYDPGLVAGIKTEIPTEARKYDGQRRAWIVAGQYGATCAQLAKTHLGVTIHVPATTTSVRRETRILDVRYVGATKDRGNGDRTAFGYANSEWSIIFPEKVLRCWFEFDDSIEPATSAKPATLYAILGVKRDATNEEIRKAYRRMAKQWHPDVCHEPDAKQRFQRIGEANTVLSDPLARKRYDAGLLFEASRPVPFYRRLANKFAALDADCYRPPLRCGYVCAVGQLAVGRFVVEKILAWEDIVDSAGRTLVTSWTAGATIFEERWV